MLKEVVWFQSYLIVKNGWHHFLYFSCSIGIVLIIRIVSRHNRVNSIFQLIRIQFEKFKKKIDYFFVVVELFICRNIQVVGICLLSGENSRLFIYAKKHDLNLLHTFMSLRNCILKKIGPYRIFYLFKKILFIEVDLTQSWTQLIVQNWFLLVDLW